MPPKCLKRLGLPAVVAVTTCLLHVGATLAQPCGTRYPHEPAPSVLWGAIQPLDTGPYPSMGKDKRATFWDGFQFANEANPLWHDVDAMGDYLVTTMPYGIQIWNVGAGQNSNIVRLHEKSGWLGDFPTWPPPGEDDFFFDNGDSLDDTATRSFFAQVGRLGLAIWSFNPQSPSTAPILHYQDATNSQSSYFDVELLKVDGTVYAFVVNGNAAARRIEVFNVSQAASFNSCLDEGGTHTSCPGIYQGSFTTGEVLLQDISGTGTFLVTTHGGGNGTRLWDVSESVTSPEMRIEVSPSDNTKNSGLWQSSAGSYGLAVQTRNRLKVYQISSACLASGTCGGSNVQTRHNQAFDGSLISVFSIGNRDFVYSADVSQCSEPDNKEELLDVTNLSAVTAIMPRNTASFPEGGPVDYAGWYTPQTGVGFLWYQPHRMTAIGNNMYRAGWTSLDHHTLGQVDPTITVDGPAVSFRDQASRFTATATNCDPATGTWSWSASGGSVSLVGNGSAADITWSTVGQKTIRAMNTACEMNTVYNDATTDVQAPEALIVDILLDGESMGSASPILQRTVCDDLTFTADVAGQLPLTYSWEIRDEQGVPIGVSSSSSSLSWTNTVSRQTNVPETLSVNLDLSNPVPSSDTESFDFELLDLPPIGFGGGVLQCSGLGNVPCGTVNGATVTVYANATGASDYQWEYRPVGGGSWTVFRAFGAGSPTEDIPLSTGEWEIRVSLENCLNESVPPTILTNTSGGTTFDIVAVPPTARFNISTPFICPGGSNCNADVGQTIAYNNTSSGDITSYEIAFENTNPSATDCSGQTFSAPQASFSHTYGFAGVYFPCIKAIGPGGSDVFVHQSLTISNAPANINVSCSPGSVQIGQSTTCSATASGCSASASGWSWNDSSGSGSSTSSTLTTSWSSAGTKTVIASNSQCGTASGSRTVTVTSGGGPGGGLSAQFTVSPDPPGLNDTTTFDSTPSTGEVARTWFIRRGGSQVHTANTVTTQYTFSQEGTYTVELNVFSQQPCSSVSCSRAANRTIVIGEGGGGPNFGADIQISPANPEVGDQVTLDGRGSGAAVVEYEWTIEGPTGSLTSDLDVVNIVFNEAGTYSATLEVRTEAGCTDAACRDVASMSFEVTEPEVLEAIFTISPEEPVVGDFVTFDGRDSTGKPTTYVWNINGQQFQGPTLIEQFVDFGDVDVMLTVSDGQQTASTSRTVRIGVECVEDNDTLCLDGRFRVTATWQTADATLGDGHVRSERTADSGLFWFFAENNIELLVKVLDGCAVNEHFWVFAAGTTDVGYTLTVEDLLAQESFEFINLVGQASPAVTETEALFTCDVSSARPQAVQSRVVDPATVPRPFARIIDVPSSGEGPPTEGDCVPGADRFCFSDGRFQVDVTWESQTGDTGVGMAGGLETPDSGVFYFFEQNNWELLVKVIDGCAITDHFWVFAAATTDQQYTLTVTDTVTGAVKQYFNPLGERAPAIADTAAFATCDA